MDFDNKVNNHYLLNITSKLAEKFDDLVFSNKNHLEHITQYNYLFIREKKPIKFSGDLIEICPFTSKNVSGKYRAIISNDIYTKSDEKYLEPGAKQTAKKKSLILDNFSDFDLLNYIGNKLLKFYGSAKVYWPSLEEYNPNLSKQDWLYLLKDRDIFDENSLFVMAAIYNIGGEATCKQLELKYGKTAPFYNLTSSMLSKRVIDRTKCPEPPKNVENARRWPVLFVGRNADSEVPGTYSWKLRTELHEALQEFGIEQYLKLEDSEGDDKMEFDKNIILYGPPGTGKTYNTICYAVAICEGKTFEEVSTEAKDNYNQVKSRYDKLKNDGQIEFTTFHQSYGYEEFIEGIRPVMNYSDEAKNIEYEISKGIFKEFCEKAKSPITKEEKMDIGLNDNPIVWKVSLEKTGNNPTRTECMENGHIRIGYDSYGESITDETDFSVDGGKTVLNAFINKMKIGDIVLSCFSATNIDAVGVVTGDYEWHEEYKKYKRVRKVNWIVKGISEDISVINGTNMTLSSVYILNVSVADVFGIIKKYHITEYAENKDKERFVFIIDEINRGNISKIFGELITLIEPSKRLGQPEEASTVLPYSKKSFGVPDNVYIIGTMNTADRSIATIDTALRRRFSFKEMLPDASLLSGIEIDTINIENMLDSMNKKISVLFDREHTIGHAYFINLLKEENKNIKFLGTIFKNSIIPLLQEYFYEDYEKIRLVLGDNRKQDEGTQFIKAVNNDYRELFGEDLDIDVSYRYEINEDAFENIASYKFI